MNTNQKVQLVISNSSTLLFSDFCNTLNAIFESLEVGEKHEYYQEFEVEFADATSAYMFGYAWCNYQLKAREQNTLR